MDSGINDWQRSAIGHVKAHGRIANREYCELNKVGQATAYRDLRDMVKNYVKEGQWKDNLLYSGLKMKR